MENDIIFDVNYSQPKKKHYTNTEKVIDVEGIMTTTNENNLTSTYGWTVS